ncbi:hypothetical protein [Bacillus thuringiensis]|uniref:hypothetical protein n=1 Tax=Bacillus thuringiensis TaxID=1428 RepID=UPI0021D64ABA|nr:hypothetical protein [Bacillus thuringiensis]MCU7667516.1 hypothetical protein [Bacillus thuringiensis]
MMMQYLIVVLNGEEYPKDRLHIETESIIVEGNIFSANDNLYSVVEKDGTVLYCHSKANVIKVHTQQHI